MRTLARSVMVMAVAATLGAAPWAAGCGGGKKGASGPVDRRTGTVEPTDENPCAGFVDAETYDELNRIFNNKRPQVGRCYAEAVREGSLDKKARGRITVEMIVTADGKAAKVRATQDTLKSAEVQSCVIAAITSWDLPVPKDNCEFSFSYDFEPE